MRLFCVSSGFGLSVAVGEGDLEEGSQGSSVLPGEEAGSCRHRGVLSESVIKEHFFFFFLPAKF